jgi:hypothetical protein
LGVSRQHVVAYHEAGHAVVAHVLGLHVESIERNQDGSGKCSIPIPGSVIDEAAVYVAGAMAAGFKFGLTYAVPSPDDRQGAHRVSPAQQLAATDRASKILSTKWPEVEALAIRLLQSPNGFISRPFASPYSNP